MPRRRIPPEVEWEIRRCARKGFSASQIYHHVQKKYPDLADKVSLRTIERRTKEYTPDDSGPWTFLNATAEEAIPVLAVIAARLSALIDIPGPIAGNPHAQFILNEWRVTTGQAKWIAKVAAVAPDLPPIIVDAIAQEYREHELPGGPSRLPLTALSDLDALLAFRPWSSEVAAKQYETLIEKGAIKPMVMAPPRWWRRLLGPDGTDEQEGMTPDQTPEGGNDGTTREE